MEGMTIVASASFQEWLINRSCGSNHARSFVFFRSRQRIPRFSSAPGENPHGRRLIARGKRYRHVLRGFETDSSDGDMEEEVKKSNEELFLCDEEEDISLDSIGPPPGFVPSTINAPFVLETDEQIAAEYEKRYGPPPQEIEEESKPFWAAEEVEKIEDGLEEKVLEVRRVARVTKSGKKIRFRVIVVVGDRKGQVGVGVGKSVEVGMAIRKAARDARREIVLVRITKHGTVPHRSNAKFKAARVMIRPGVPCSGLRVGGAMNVVLDMAGVQNVIGKQFGSENLLNNARATLIAVKKMRFTSEIAREFGIPLSEFLNRESLKRI